MPRPRTTKAIAKRVDFSYLNQPQPLRRARLWVSLLAVLLALGWFAWAGVSYDGDRPRLVGMIHNPGPVSSAHAYFEHNCSACHKGPEGDWFARGVTDSACLACHDGAIHHANQHVAESPHDVSRATLRLAVKNPDHPFDMHSAACVTCHVEHRGRPALAATSDQHCLICHQDLSMAAHAPAAIPNRIEAFAVNRHPEFGRALRGDTGWLDKTPLKFNHLAHQGHIKPPAGLEHNCVLCHQAQDPAARLPMLEEQIPPYPDAKGRPLAWGNSSDRKYIQPISFARHCAACHKMDLPGLETLDHVDFELVRAQLADPQRLYSEVLSAMTPQERKELLTRKTRRRGKESVETIAPEQWIESRMEELQEQVQNWFSPEQRDLPNYGAARNLARNAADQLDPAALAYYVFYRSGTNVNGCIKCHNDNGGALSADAERSLRTAATGISASPRRWFASSEFNHDSHRHMSCLECHAQAKESTLTSDLLLPDMTTRGELGMSCADCHNPNPPMRAAPAGCVTCHLYHDRTLERLSHAAPLLPATTQPAAAP